MHNQSKEASLGLIESVSVALGARSYEIAIGAGLLAKAGALLTPHLSSKRVVIISDATVAPLHLDSLVTGLKESHLSIETMILPAGEATKSFAHYEKLMNDLLALRLSRKDTLIAFGGGVIGDLVGFAASTLLRGVPFIQVPTTLLSQVDSSVGGKTGINTAAGKNLIGAFYQPKYVMIDLDVLKTLPKREMLAGYAEVVKYGLLGSADFFTWLEAQGQALLAGCQKRLAHAIATSCRMKAQIVAQDEREQGQRALLNLGHTFGHALEAELGYDGRLLHGEAVAIGMVLAFDYSVALGLCKDGDAARVRAHLASVGLPVQIKDRLDSWQAETLVDHMGSDKKTEGSVLNFVLATAIGKAKMQAVTEKKSLLRLLSA